MKSEPDCYSIEDLQKEKRTMWDGTRNWQVRNFMRDQMQVGDRAFFYHSSAGTETGIAGTMKIVNAAYPDPTQFDLNSEHPDPKSSKDNPRWLAVDVEFEEKFPRILTLKALKQVSALQDMQLLKIGNRLSVMPVTKHEWQTIMKLRTVL